MASKILNTRIKNRFDSLSAWQADGVELLKGEIALVSVTTQHKDANGNIVNVPAVLMKVGNVDGQGNAIPFNSLPWLSAKAADVYDWAKVQYAANIPVTFNEDNSVKETLNDYLVKVNATSAEVAAIKEIFSVVDEGTGSFVTDVAYDAVTGKFTISRSNVDTNDIVDGAVTEGKLAADAVTTVKIKDGSVTDAKIAKGIAAEKILYTKGETADKDVYLPEKFADVESKIANINTAISGGVHFIGITTTELTDGSVTGTIKIDGSDYTANNGDVVIYKANAATAEDEEREFIWVKPNEDAAGHWEALGDLSRVGALEDLLSTLSESARTANQYVTHIAKENGKLVAKKAQPAASEISYSDPTYTTVEAKIGAIDAAIAEKADEEHSHAEYVNQDAFSNIKVGDVTVTADEATDTIEFVGSNITITADAETDKVTFEIASGTVDEAGIVKLYAGIDKDDDTLAATAGAVKAAYDKAVDAEAAAASAATDIAANYVAVDENKNLVHIQKAGEATVIDTIILDCGGASTSI
jgi:hypothetical protein